MAWEEGAEVARLGSSAARKSLYFSLEKPARRGSPGGAAFSVGCAGHHQRDFQIGFLSPEDCVLHC